MGKCILCGARDNITKEGSECRLCYSDRFTDCEHPWHEQKYFIQGINWKTYKEAVQLLEEYA